MKKYKAVVIGCGRIGAQEWNYSRNVRPATHAAAYFKNSKIELVGLCDIDSEKLKKAKKLFPDVSLYSSAKKMLKETKPDIVSVATHTNTHYKFVKMAAGLGVKAIVCEKPIADSLGEAKEMVKLCRQKKCLLFVNHSRHFDSLIQRWQRKVKNGILGNVLQSYSAYHNGLFNNGTHIMDLLRMFLGEVKEVIGFYNNLTSNPKRDKNVDAIIFFKSGARAFLQSVSEKQKLTEWSFYGEKNKLFLKKLGMQISYNNLKIGSQRSLMAQMVWHIVSCLEKRERPQSTGQDGLEVLKVLFAIKKSANNNGKIINVVH
ncbi:MAG: Gfo/Idh/MocA family oxidoreductase [Patescibacteria group bacterium]